MDVKENKKVKKVKSGHKKSPFRAIKGLVSEFKKITWATKEDIQKATLSVVVVCGIFVIAMALLDLGFSNLYPAIFK